MSNSFLPTTAHQMAPKHPQRQRKVLTGLLIATGAAMVFLPARGQTPSCSISS